MSLFFSMLLARWNWLLSGVGGGLCTPQTPPGYGPGRQRVVGQSAHCTNVYISACAGHYTYLL